MTEKISHLCDEILKKAHEFVSVGDFTAVSAAADAIKSVASIQLPELPANSTDSPIDPTNASRLDDIPGPESPSPGADPSPSPSQTASSSSQNENSEQASPAVNPESGGDSPSATDDAPDHDRVIDQMLRRELAFVDEDWEFLSLPWVTISSAATFADVSVDTVRNWCDENKVLCRRDPTRKRNTWLVCPRSIALRSNRYADPRIQND